MRFELPLSVAALLMFSGCAELQRQAIEQRCSADSAYEQGMNDSREGKRMDSSFARICDAPARTQVTAAYRDGYTTGAKAVTPTLAQPVGQSPVPGSVPLIQVNLGGSAPAQPAAPHPRAFFCKVGAFTRTFESFGPTELEAKHSAVAACTAQYNRIHCESVSCQPNQ